MLTWSFGVYAGRTRCICLYRTVLPLLMDSKNWSSFDLDFGVTIYPCAIPFPKQNLQCDVCRLHSLIKQWSPTLIVDHWLIHWLYHPLFLYSFTCMTLPLQQYPVYVTTLSFIHILAIVTTLFTLLALIKTVVSKKYYEFLDIFSKKASDTLLPHSKYNHQICLLEEYRRDYSHSLFSKMSEPKLQFVKNS